MIPVLDFPHRQALEHVMALDFKLSRRQACIGLATSVFIPSFAKIAFAETPEIFTRRGLAIGGYDPVAYFVAGEPQKGSESLEISYKGAKWRFANSDNLEAFRSNPEIYTPQYGGYCAWAVSFGYTASIHPEAWSIENNKLYLNYSKSVRRQWLEDKDNRITLADQNWPAVLDR